MHDVCGSRELMDNLRPTCNAEKDGPLKFNELLAFDIDRLRTCITKIYYSQNSVNFPNLMLKSV